MIPEPVPMAPLVIVLVLLCASFAWAAVNSGIAAAKGKLAGEWVLWTVRSEEDPHPAATDTTATDGVTVDPDLRQVKVSWKSLGFGLAGLAGILSMLCAMVIIGAVSTYPRNYDRAVWGALGEQYGIHAAIPEQGFQPGVSFPALLEGKTVDCVATPPSMVVCDGKALPSRN